MYLYVSLSVGVGGCVCVWVGGGCVCVGAGGVWGDV